MPGLLRVTPACCITFVVYENMITYLLHNNKTTDTNENASGAKFVTSSDSSAAVGSTSVFSGASGSIRVEAIKQKLRDVENIGELNKEANLEESIIDEGVKT